MNTVARTKTLRKCCVIRMFAFVAMAFTLSMPIIAASQATGAAEESHNNAEVREFLNQEEFLAALSAEVDRLRLKDVRVTRGASDEVVGVTFKKKSDVKKVLRRLGGGVGAFTVSDKTVKVETLIRLLHRPHRVSATKNGSPAADAESASIAALSIGLPEENITVCDPYGGDFCTYNSTNNDHYTVFGWGYHDVSSGTMQRQGGFQRMGYKAFARCDGYGWGGNCAHYAYYCNPGDTLSNVVNNRNSAWWCSSGYNELFLTNFYFANIDGRPEMIRQEFTATRNKDRLYLGHETFGKFIFPCRTGACVVEGICARHSSYGNGGSTEVTTAAGSYDCE